VFDLNSQKAFFLDESTKVCLIQEESKKFNLTIKKAIMLLPMIYR
jgi:hypothetical protein